MEDLDNKVTGGALTAQQWNDTRTEAQNVVIGTGQALSGSDPNQLGKAVAQYAANGDFYTDGGVANAYTLSTLESKQAPSSYIDGMTVRFVATNANTGATTVNVAGLGVKSVVVSGVPLTANQIVGSVNIVYSLSNDRFDLQTDTVSLNLTASSGHKIGADGLIEQWGEASFTIAGSAVLFDIPFPSECMRVFCTDDSLVVATNNTIGANTKTTTGFNFVGDGAGIAAYYAIGF